MKAAIALILIATLVAAAPSPPEIIVNNRTMECSPYNAGDECTRCAVPDGWAGLGYGTVECPQGYAETRAPIVCTPAANERCCSEGHSGAPGECGRMIVNRLAGQCRFLPENESIRPGWEGKADGSEEWECPEGFAWVENAGPCQFPTAIIGALAAFTFISFRKNGKTG